MDDLSIKNNVEEELQYEPSVNAAEIGVAVKDGIVTLTGRVHSYLEKMAAARAATRVAASSPSGTAITLITSKSPRPRARASAPVRAITTEQA